MVNVVKGRASGSIFCFEVAQVLVGKRVYNSVVTLARSNSFLRLVSVVVRMISSESCNFSENRLHGIYICIYSGSSFIRPLALSGCFPWGQTATIHSNSHPLIWSARQCLHLSWGHRWPDKRATTAYMPCSSVGAGQ